MNQEPKWIEGLSELQKKWALEQEAFFKRMRVGNGKKKMKVAIPYGLIREQALKKLPPNR